MPNYRSKKNEVGIIWNDENLKINWPSKKPLVSRKDKKNLSWNKYIYFGIGFFVLVCSEITVRYSGSSILSIFLYYFIPIGLLPIVYLTLLRKFKYENLN